MLLGSRPLYDNLGDSRLFRSPPAWGPILRAGERHLNVAVVGPRGVGKTSLLRQLQLALREGSAERVTFVDATAVADVLELAARIRDAVIGGESARAEGLRGAAAPVGGASRELAALLREIGEADPSTILVDSSSSAAAVYGLFGRMRDVLWQQEHRWVVALEDTDRASALKPPADAFFDAVIPVDPWPADELVELLAQRAGSNGAWPRELLVSAATAANGSPRQALRALSDAVVHDRDPAVGLDERGRLVERAAEQGRPAGILMAELLDRGQASPSDGDLQRTLGVTRSRLTQLLRQLLAKDLVTVEDERPDGPGRPRVVYRPALPR
ncbi:MAG: AAA family ATPase [Actinobacteria bacterium]|nr:AAA family ATPase [Actinomycetota bacterium]